jgi:hypothetical protein
MLMKSISKYVKMSGQVNSSAHTTNALKLQII